MDEDARSVDGPSDEDAWRVPVDAEIQQALLRTPRKLLVPGVCEPMATLDAPVGCLSPLEPAPPCPSPAAAGLLLQAADLSPGDRVLVQGRGIGWIALAASVLTKEAMVWVEEEHEGLRARWREAHPFRMRDSIRLKDAGRASNANVDRVIAWNPGGGASDRLPRRLDEEGSILLAASDPEDPKLERIVRQGEAEATLSLTELAPGTGTGPGAGAAPAGTVGDLLRQESLLASAWTDERPPGLAREIGLSVDETIGRALAERRLTGRVPERAAAARIAFHLGYTHQTLGNLQDAAEAYTASSRALATAEAYTFRGWVRSHQDRISEAIEDCRRAIDEDPTLGNPYNDIGAYRLEQNRPREAIEWFEKAVEAERYASPEFPYLNMARAHLLLDEPEKARASLHEALDLRPGFQPAQRLLDRIDQETGGFRR